MADYTNRDTLLREILKANANPWYEWDAADIIKLMYAQPKSDVVEVVRCCFCKWYDKEECPLVFEDEELVNDIGGHPARLRENRACWTGFCYKGERKE